MTIFQKDILTGIPAILPQPKPYDLNINHAPKRKDILSAEEKVLAIKNALRYFPQEHHKVLATPAAMILPIPPTLGTATTIAATPQAAA